MEDIKEKLVELLDVSVAIANNMCDTVSCAGCEGRGENGCTLYYVANHLIANGVTVQELDGCKYCEEYEDLPEHFVDGKPVGRVFDTCIQPDKNGLWHLEVPGGADIGIRFCSMCGRRLPQPPKGD